MLNKRSIIGITALFFAVFSLIGCSNNSENSGKTNQPPKITSIQPISGPAGTVVTIKGKHFANVNAVKFDDAEASITDQSNSKLDVKVPQNLTADTGYKVTLLTNNKPTAAPDSFKVTKSNCFAQLFDGDHFKDDNIVLEGPGKFKSLANLPDAQVSWNGEADSFKAGKTATVTVWAKTNFKGESTVYKPGTEIPSVTNEFSSVKITCEQQQ